MINMNGFEANTEYLSVELINLKTELMKKKDEASALHERAAHLQWMIVCAESNKATEEEDRNSFRVMIQEIIKVDTHGVKKLTDLPGPFGVDNAILAEKENSETKLRELQHMGEKRKNVINELRLTISNLQKEQPSALMKYPIEDSYE